MSHTISPIPIASASSWAVQKSIKPISKKTQYQNGKRIINEYISKEYNTTESEISNEQNTYFFDRAKKFKEMFNNSGSDVILEVEKLIKNLLTDDNTKITRNFNNYAIENMEETNNGYYRVDLGINKEEIHINFRINIYGVNAKNFNTELSYESSLYEKFKDELDVYAIQSKKKDFFNCLELFYQHNGLNRKDKLEKLLK